VMNPHMKNREVKTVIANILLFAGARVAFSFVAVVVIGSPIIILSLEY
jgi:hypothetical protein